MTYNSHKNGDINSVNDMRLSHDNVYGVYVHIPFCKSKCSYCAFCSTPDLRLQQPYISSLEKEILSYSGKTRYKADTVYIGGGTPSCLFGGALRRIFDALQRTFSVDACAEITVEVNPESCTQEFLSECRDCGVNRISMGMQSCDNEVLRAVNRRHDYNRFISAVKLLKTEGFDNISTDFILGLPKQTHDDIIRCVDVAAEYCTHASVYALTVEEGTPLFATDYRPNDDAVADLYKAACNKLAACGFVRYEVSNFARDGKVSRHNVKYWRCEPYVGFGAAAHGYDGRFFRYSHTEDVGKYIAGTPLEITELDKKDLYNEYIMLNLRTESGILCKDFKCRFGTEFEVEAGEALRTLVKRGLIIYDGRSARIAPDKMFVMNGIIEDLMV